MAFQLSTKPKRFNDTDRDWAGILDSLITKPRVTAFGAQPVEDPEPEPIAIEGPKEPTYLERLEQQSNAQPSRRERILKAVIPAVGIGLGAAFGGQAGATGAAEGVNENLQREQVMEQNRKKTLLQQIEDEKNRQESRAQNQATLAQQVAAMNQAATQKGLDRQNAITVAETRKPEPVPGRDIPFSPDVMLQQQELKEPALIAGRDIPLPEDVVAQRREIAASSGKPVPGRDIPYSAAVEEQRKRMNANRAAQNGLSPQQFNKVQTLAAQFDSNPVIKDFNVTSNKAATVKRILDAPLGGPSDLALVFEFMKGLDPTSVVRESEYETASKSGNIFKGIYAKFNGYLKPEGGFLPPEVKKSFSGILQQKLASSSKQVKGMHQDFGRRIEKITGQPGGADWLTDYTNIGLGDDEPTGKNLKSDMNTPTAADFKGVPPGKALKSSDGKLWVLENGKVVAR